MTANLEEGTGDQARNSSTEHLKPWQFKPGQSGNPSGRPPGKSLKEYAKEMLASMDEEQRQKFLEGIDKKVIWEMAEGGAKSNVDVTTDGKPLTFAVVSYADNTNTPSISTEELPATPTESA